MRLHPAASRVTRLAKETPARLMLFDLLQSCGHSLMGLPLSTRRDRLEDLLRSIGRTRTFQLSPVTQDRKRALQWLCGAIIGTDGVVAKRLDSAYEPGERAMINKRIRTADCVVGGFRYASKSRQVGSLLLGLYDRAGLLHHVGFTSSIAKSDRAALTKKLEARRKAPGFTGRAPGGPSRWSTERSSEWEPLRPDLVVEVQYDHVAGGRFRHGAKFLRWRLDKAPKECRFEQIGLPEV
jgi:ATP-dependent DNA ligase